MSDSGFGTVVVVAVPFFLSSDDANERVVPVPVSDDDVPVAVVAIDGCTLRIDNNLLDDDDDDDDEKKNKLLIRRDIVMVVVATDRFIVAFATVAAVAADNMIY